MDRARTRLASKPVGNNVMMRLCLAVGPAIASAFQRTPNAACRGCACERLVLVLADAIVSAGHSPWSGKLKKKMDGPPSSISRLFDDVRDCPVHLWDDKKLLGPLRGALDRKLSAIPDHARGLRNDSGHPTGTEVADDDAEAGLLMFAGFHAFVCDLSSSL